MKKLVIDLNSDVGEGFGPYKMGQDEELFQYITSANIACGYHAGDPSTIRKTLDLAARHGICVGAHPGYPDRLHFGRIALPYGADEVTDFILYQIGALQLMAERAGLTLQHVKLHAAAQDQMLAETFLDAMVRLKHSFIIVGPPDCMLQHEAEDRGLDYAAEGFADRGYSEQGKLLPRGSEGALLTNPEQAAEQAIQIVRERHVTANSGIKLDLKINTLCIHGDTPGATEIAKAVRQGLEAAKIAVEPLHKILES
jgi:UPF0271 protein